MKTKTFLRFLVAALLTASRFTIFAADVTGTRLNIGVGHSLSGTDSSIAGGFTNKISANYAAIAGGAVNWVTNDYSFIGGGDNNTVGNIDSAIVGGELNQVTSSYSFLGGGQLNAISGASDYTQCSAGVTTTSSPPIMLESWEGTATAQLATSLSQAAAISIRTTRTAALTVLVSQALPNRL